LLGTKGYVVVVVVVKEVVYSYDLKKLFHHFR
jgi:hypothetical protein